MAGASPTAPKSAALLVQGLLLVVVPTLIWKLPLVRRIFPLVIIQISFGILIGPSGLGAWSPTIFKWLFAAPDKAALTGAASWGTLLFVFFTGLHIEKEMFFRRGAGVAKTWILGTVTMFLPFALGVAFGYIALSVLDPKQIIGTANQTNVFIISIGICTGVTALPVLSAMLLEMNILSTPFGKMVTTCATLHDLFLWILMTVVLSLVKNKDAFAGHLQPLATLGLTFAHAVLLFGLFSPAATKFVTTPTWQRQAPLTKLLITIGLLILSSLICELIQVHSLLGAVMFGAAVPRSEKHAICEQVDLLNRSLFLPLAFGSAGLNVNLRGEFSTQGWLVLGLFLSTFIGCFASALPAAKILKFPMPTAICMAACMASKGVVELVISLVLLQRGAISQRTYSALIVNCIICTSLNKPVIHLVERVWKDSAPTLFDHGISVEKGAFDTSELHRGDLQTETVRVEQCHAYPADLAAAGLNPHTPGSHVV